MMKVRPATVHDKSSLERVFLEARSEAFAWCDASVFQLSDFSAQTEGEIVHVAEGDQGEILGFISIWTAESFVHHLFVDPKHQGTGVGTRLLNSLRAWLPMPYKLKCLLKNSAAYGFYLRQGWKEVGRGSDKIGEYAVMTYQPAESANSNPA